MKKTLVVGTCLAAWVGMACAGGDIQPFQAQTVQPYQAQTIKPYQARTIKPHQGSGTIQPYQGTGTIAPYQGTGTVKAYEGTGTVKAHKGHAMPAPSQASHSRQASSKDAAAPAAPNAQQLYWQQQIMHRQTEAFNPYVTYGGH